MALSTNLISGLSSGFDWRSMIDQLMTVEHRRVDLVTAKKSTSQKKLTEWQSFNTKLLSLKTAAGGLKSSSSFALFTTSLSSSDSSVKASDLLMTSASSDAAPGSYDVIVTETARAQKLSSGSFSSLTNALGSTYAGDLLINGQVVNITATDNLTDIRNKINALNGGTDPTRVIAGIINYGESDYRFVLTSQVTGEAGISLLNGSENDILGNLGITETAAAIYSVKNAVTGGAQSDRFSGVNETIAQLLSLNTAASSTTLQIRDATDTLSNNISIDLAAMDLNDIRDAINANKGAANIVASVETEVIGGITYYRLQIDGLNGTDPFEDSKNIFQTLGFTKGAVGDVFGVTGSAAKTSGGTVISASTLLSGIDGYMSWTAGDHLDFTGTDTSGNAVNMEFAVTGTSTMQDLMTALESAYGNVKAGITGEGKLLLTDLTTNRPGNLSVTITDTIADASDLDFGFSAATATTVRKREITAGTDALISIDGVSVKRSSNTISDVISGVTLNLLKKDAGTTVTVRIEQDLNAISEKIRGFVDAYNDVAEYIKNQQLYDKDKKTGGVLFGDGTLSSIKSDLTTTLVESISGAASDLSSLGLIGINLDNEGKLSIDKAILTNQLQTRFNDVQALFSIKATLTAGSLEYISSSRLTRPGEYPVNITRIATQSSVTSATAVAGTLGSDETITVTENGKAASVSLTAGMSMADIMNILNTEFGASYSQTLVGGDALYSDSGATTSITSETTWGSIYKSADVSANLADSDLISFSGTGRAGETISGSYRINSAASDTVQGLLTAIEQTFSGTVYARISSDGKITVTDRRTGNSSLSISFDMSQAHDLSFGTVDNENTGGRTGRLRLDLMASEDAGHHLILNHNAYGSSSTFTVSESADLLWPTGDQTADNGEDVAGTIDGKAATGMGQSLTGNIGESGVEGLVIKYTGAATGAIGSITLSMGIGELFDRALFQITDSASGYLSFKTKSMQGEIDSADTQIEQMEARLNKKMEMMINRFVAMETALARMQSQSNWLAGQINATLTGWR